MMKNVIVFTLCSLLGLFGFVVGFPGLDLAQAAKEKDCTIKPHPKGKTKIKKVDEDFGKDVLAVFVLKADGNIEVMEGYNKNFREPMDASGKPPKDLDTQPPASKVSNAIPQDAPMDVHAGFKLGQIETYVGNTCVRVNGILYCW